MSEEMTPTPVDETKPSAPAPATTTAESYVQEELRAARATLRNTQIIGSIIVIALGIYMIVLAAKFSYFLKPDVAVDVATGFVSTQIDAHSDAFIDDMKVRIPEMIQGLPELVTAQFQPFREGIEERFDDGMTKYTQSTKEKLAANLDEYITTNKTQLKAVLDASKDPKAVEKLAPTLRAEVMAFFKEQPAEGDSIDKQVNDSLDMLKDAEQRLHRLATAKNLTPEEKKTRRAIAIIANTIDKENLEPLILPKLNTAEDAAAEDTAE